MAKIQFRKRILILFKVNWMKIKSNVITNQRTLKIVRKNCQKIFKKCQKNPLKTNNNHFEKSLKKSAVNNLTASCWITSSWPLFRLSRDSSDWSRRSLCQCLTIDISILFSISQSTSHWPSPNQIHRTTDSTCPLPTFKFFFFFFFCVNIQTKQKGLQMLIKKWGHFLVLAYILQLQKKKLHKSAAVKHYSADNESMELRKSLFKVVESFIRFISRHFSVTKAIQSVNFIQKWIDSVT